MRNLSLLLTLILALAAAPAFSQQKTKSASKTKEVTSTVTLALREGVVIEKVEKLSRPSAQAVCAGEKIAFEASVNDSAGRLTGEVARSQVRWQPTAGRGATDEAGRFVVDTTDLAPGTYVVTADILDDASGCTAYDSKVFTVSPCIPIRRCFMPNVLTLSTPAQTINAGETIKIYASRIEGGENYGKLTATWTASEGRITGDFESARLDTTGVLPGSTIRVRFDITSEMPGCEAGGELTLRLAVPPPVKPPTITPCFTFKFNNGRVDNACKYTLQDIIKQLEADPQAQLVIDSYYHEGESPAVAALRGKNVRDRLADGSLGATIDENRLIVRPSGKAVDRDQVKLILVPAGTPIPSGARAMDAGPVTKEPSRPATKRRRR
jgi:hypothetical protein